jgi:hypothetical protein
MQVASNIGIQQYQPHEHMPQREKVPSIPLPSKISTKS